MRRMAIVVFLCVVAMTQISAGQSSVPQKQADGIVIPLQDGFLKIAVRADNIVHVEYAKERSYFEHKSLTVVAAKETTPDWKLGGDAKETTITTAKLKVRVDLATGAIRFFDAEGQAILAEKDGGRTITPAEVQGEKTLHVQQRWEAADESLYGLGENQLGLLDIKGYDLDLWQHNGTDVVPFLVSSRGYGIFWDNTSFTRFGDLRPFEAIPAVQLFDTNGKPGGLTGFYYAGAHFERLVAKRVDPKIDIDIAGQTHEPNRIIHPDLPEGDVSVRWEGNLEPAATGDYLFQAFSNSGIKLWIGDQLVMNHWRQSWLPWKDLARMHLDAKKRYHVRLEWTKDQDGLIAMNLAMENSMRRSTGLRFGRKSATASIITLFMDRSRIKLWRDTGRLPVQRR